MMRKLHLHITIVCSSNSYDDDDDDVPSGIYFIGNKFIFLKYGTNKLFMFVVYYVMLCLLNVIDT